MDCTTFLALIPGIEIHFLVVTLPYIMLAVVSRQAAHSVAKVRAVWPRKGTAHRDDEISSHLFPVTELQSADRATETTATGPDCGAAALHPLIN
ncbi:hypothetical protein J6590_019058 [Homalodisca vitripennis]|nr:hypothetical protein J6590_019058 [Homalodisca vitripennis]